MSQDYDPTVKALVEFDPASWPPFCGRPAAPTTVITPEVAGTISGAADAFLRVQADPAYIPHLEFQSGHDSAQLPPRLRMYNTIADFKQELPVRSVAVILRPEADSPRLTGVLVRGLPGEEPYDVFRYDVIRVWQMPTERPAGRTAGDAAIGAAERPGRAGGSPRHPADEGALAGRGASQGVVDGNAGASGAEPSAGPGGHSLAGGPRHERIFDISADRGRRSRRGPRRGGTPLLEDTGPRQIRATRRAGAGGHRRH